MITHFKIVENSEKCLIFFCLKMFNNMLLRLVEIIVSNPLNAYQIKGPKYNSFKIILISTNSTFDDEFSCYQCVFVFLLWSWLLNRFFFMWTIIGGSKHNMYIYVCIAARIHCSHIYNAASRSRCVTSVNIDRR